MTAAPYDQGGDSRDEWHQLQALVGSLRRRIANQEAEIAAQEATIAMLRRKLRRTSRLRKIAAAMSWQHGGGSDSPVELTPPSAPGLSRTRRPR